MAAFNKHGRQSTQSEPAHHSTWRCQIQQVLFLMQVRKPRLVTLPVTPAHKQFPIYVAKPLCYNIFVLSENECKIAAWHPMLLDHFWCIKSHPLDKQAKSQLHLSVEHTQEGTPNEIQSRDCDCNFRSYFFILKPASLQTQRTGKPLWQSWVL